MSISVVKLERAKDQFIVPLEHFRKEHIGGAKEEKKKFEKQTAKFIQSQERHLNLSTKKQDSVLQEVNLISAPLLLCLLTVDLPPSNSGRCNPGDGTAPLLPSQFGVCIPPSGGPRKEEV